MYYPAPTRVRLHCSARTSPRSRHQLRRAVAPTFPRALHPCTTLHQPASACIAPHEQALARRMGGGRPPHQCTHGPDAQPHRCPVHPPHSPPTFCRTQLSCRLSWELEQGLKLKKEQVFFLISDKFVTDFPYCQVFDRQFFVLNVKQIRKSTISFGLLIQMEGKF